MNNHLLAHIMFVYLLFDLTLLMQFKFNAGDPLYTHHTVGSVVDNSLQHFFFFFFKVEGD